MLEVILSCGKQPLLLEEFKDNPLGEVFLSTLKLTVLLSFYILAQWSPPIPDSKALWFESHQLSFCHFTSWHNCHLPYPILKLSGSNRTNSDFTTILQPGAMAQWSPSKTQILKLSGSNRTNL